MLKYLLLPVLITLSLACGPVDEEAEANKRFVEAVALLEAAESEPAAPAKLSLLEQAETTLQTIITRYPSTGLAVKLTSGQQIGNVSLAIVEAAVKDARGPACQAAPTSACVIAQALDLAQTLEWGQDSALVHITGALIDIALAQAQAEDRVEARATIAQALALAQTFDKTDRAMALPDIALAQARAGDRTGARATIAQALALAQTLTDEEGQTLTDEGGRATLLAIVALAQAQAGDRAGARATIAQASAFVQTLTDKLDQATALGFVAQAQAQSGNHAGARETTSQVLALTQELARALPDGEGRGEALASLVFLWPQVKAGDTAQALALAQTFTHDWVRASALTFVARAQAQAGDRTGAQATISQALTHVQALTSEISRARILGDIAPAQAQAGDRAGAQATIAQLQALTQTFPEISRTGVLASIAQSQAYMGDGVQALALAQTLSSEGDRVKALADIALALARVDAADT